MHWLASLFAGIAVFFGGVFGSSPVAPAQTSPQEPAEVTSSTTAPSTSNSAKTPTAVQPTTNTQSQSSSAVSTKPVATSPSTPTASTTPPVGAYVNTVYHFWMQFPVGWQNDGNGFVYPSITYWSPDKLASIRIWISEPYSAGTPIATLLANANGKVTELKKDLPTFVTTVNSSTIVNGEPAWILAGTWTDLNGNQESTVILTVYHDGRIFELTATSFSSTLLAFSNDIVSAMRSLAFTD